MSPQRASCGLSIPVINELSTSLVMIKDMGFDFAVTPVFHPRFRLNENISEPSALSKETDEEIVVRDYPITRSDLILNSRDWSTFLVGVISRHLNVDSTVERVRRKAEEALKTELQFCSHLGLSAIMLELTKPNNTNLARLIYSYMVKQHHQGQHVWIRIPLSKAKSLSDSSKETGEARDTWHWWNKFRSTANYARKIGLALSIEDNSEIPDSIVQRWVGEPVKVIIVNTKLFLNNKKGYPVLPRVIQGLINKFIALDVQFILEGTSQNNHNMSLYYSYLDHLCKIYTPPDHLIKTYSKGFEDYLQSPLQPLMDNLESGTYEVFEKDPVKYSEYQKAIAMAIKDKRPDEGDKENQLTIMVLGAGRGPLVKASLAAAKTADRKVRVFAVEKNPNAVVTLLNLKDEIWKDQVSVISSDMRAWVPKADDKADIVVSELLGSFGDNELSPECLYSAQHIFKQDAISIPCSYTSWIGPLQSSKLYNEVRSSVDIEKPPSSHYETPYVVHLQNRVELAKPKPLFTFEHPVQHDIDNRRYGCLHFKSIIDAELHGFAGYFECILYKDIMISINPDTHSKGMFSWFPIFFPLKRPVRVSKDDDIELHFWRINNNKEVWYEWNITNPDVLPIHNSNGRSYTIGL